MLNKKPIFILINAMGAGGAERVVANILPALTKKYSVHLILLQDTLFYDLPQNISVHSLSHGKSNLLMIPLFPFYIWKLKKLTNKYKPNKIISLLEIANFVNILTNKKAIISFRTSLSFFEKSFFGKIYILAIRSLYHRANKIIVNSEENKIDLSKKLNIPLEKITTIYNPINIAEINSLKNKLVELPFSRRDQQKIFVTIGRMDKLKNISTIINSFRDASKKNILLVIGDGPEKPALKKLITQNNLQNQIFLLGQKKNVYKYLNIADYFIFSSRAEGFPNVLIEAIVCNLPIITSDFETGAREIINSKLGFKEKIKYPYYGPNGALLSLENFKEGFVKINFNKITTSQDILVNFNIIEITKKWIHTIESN
jgi:N-acetylgalactosamine-N,N'-diacetylbacillosaminyl-diphospho-undecaprenol 4-alpha-N-acetylgalactosaminyltransferase